MILATADCPRTGARAKLAATRRGSLFFSRLPLQFGCALGGAVLVGGCASTPVPTMLAPVDRVRSEPSVLATRETSPSLWARAESLRARAESAWRAGDSRGAELLAGDALATYARAVATAREIEARERADLARVRLLRAGERLAADEVSRLEIDREADALEAQIAVRSGAIAPIASGPTDPAREQARWAVVRANLSMADALCRGAELLLPTARGLAGAKLAVAVVTAKSGEKLAAAPIDASTRARALCLGALTAARDATVAAGGAEGATIAEALASAGLATARDERGLIVALPGAFAAKSATLSGDAKRSLQAIATVAAAHPHFAVLVVVHDAPTGAAPRLGDFTSTAKARATAVRDALVGAGIDAARIATHLPGTAQPSHDLADAKERGRNERVELVLVGTAP